MARFSISKTRKRLPRRTHLVLVGIMVALLIVPALAKLFTAPGMGELMGADKRIAHARITRVEPMLGQRKWVYFELRGKERAFRWPVTVSPSDPDMGMPVTVDYLIGKSGRVYITRIEPRRDTEPRIVRRRSHLR